MADLGTRSRSSPVVSRGLVWVGTNNGRPRDPNVKGDAAVLMCFREADGKFLWQYASPRLADPHWLALGSVDDFPVGTLSRRMAGELAVVADKLANAGLNLHALYVIGLAGDLVELAISVDDPKKAKKALE